MSSEEQNDLTVLRRQLEQQKLRTRKLERQIEELKASNCLFTTGQCVREGDSLCGTDIFDGLNIAAIVYKPIAGGEDFEILSANNSCLKIEGLKSEDLIGKKVTDVFPGIHRYGFLELFRRVWRSGRAEKMPTRHYQDNRIEGWRESFAFRAGVGVACIYTDQTKAMNEKHELEMCRKIVDSSKDMMLLINRERCVNAVNEACCKFFKLGRSTFDNLPLEQLLGKEADREGYATSIEKAFGGEPVEFETKLETSGVGRSVQCCVLPELSNPHLLIKYVVLVIRDVTQAKILEKSRVLNDVAKSREEATTNFLSNMSHELRTPLNGIIGMTELLKQSELPEREMKFVEMLQQSGNGLLNVMNDILDYSRIRAGSMSYENAPFDIQKLIQEQGCIYKPLAEAQKCSVKTRVSDNVPSLLSGDAFRIRQVLINLLSNALEHSGARNIELTTDWKRHEQDGILTLRVKDDGMGIPLERREVIFQPFLQTEGRQPTGSAGLGLAISRGITRDLGGNLTLGSPDAGGTEFVASFRLKAGIAPIHVPSEKREPRQSSSFRDINILVVEDDAVSRSALTVILRKFECIVDSVDDGEHAVKACEEKYYDAVFLDLRLPDFSGYDVAEEMRLINGTPPKAIIGVSAALTGEEKKRCLEAGMDAFLPKPLKAKELRDTLFRVAMKE